MRLNKCVFLCLTIIYVAAICGCASRDSFTTAARAGDTISLPIGWHPQVRREDLTITLTPQTGSQVVYAPGDPAVLAVANLSPDPLSKLTVQRETRGIYEDPIAFDAWLLEGAVTMGDKEYSEKFVLLDLPQTIAEGSLDIAIQSTTGDTINPLKVEILPGQGAPNTFGNWNGWSLDTAHLRYMERAPYYEVDFTGSTIPYAIQVELMHDPDESSGGVGVPYVVNQRGDIKSVIWSDDGTRLRVVVTPTGMAALSDIKHFKFYVAGGLSGLQVSTVSAYDIEGASVGEVVANITAHP